MRDVLAAASGYGARTVQGPPVPPISRRAQQPGPGAPEPTSIDADELHHARGDRRVRRLLKKATAYGRSQGQGQPKAQ